MSLFFIALSLSKFIWSVHRLPAPVEMSMPQEQGPHLCFHCPAPGEAQWMNESALKTRPLVGMLAKLASLVRWFWLHCAKEKLVLERHLMPSPWLYFFEIRLWGSAADLWVSVLGQWQNRACPVMSLWPVSVLDLEVKSLGGLATAVLRYTCSLKLWLHLLNSFQPSPF